jgi:hypothetical protein
MDKENLNQLAWKVLRACGAEPEHPHLIDRAEDVIADALRAAGTRDFKLVAIGRPDADMIEGSRWLPSESVALLVTSSDDAARSLARFIGEHISLGQAAAADATAIAAAEERGAMWMQEAAVRAMDAHTEQLYQDRAATVGNGAASAARVAAALSPAEVCAARRGR